ncbi:MAG TPA: chorismate mutase [Alphaproteobacteria bacterium]|nr:chorismate mutase [Alphaproteobacteria bacterium]
MSSLPSDLAHRRAEIDKYDREIHRLLIERAKVVYGVMRAKAAATAAGEVTPPFRPGREAEVLRALVARHEGEFPQVSLLRIWREIMSGATRMQAVQNIVVPAAFGPGWVLARDHFGMGAEYRAAESAAEVLELVRRQEVAAAVVPLPASEGDGAWWRELLDNPSQKGAPQVVARLPFFGMAEGLGSALVLSAFPPDASSEDHGVLGIRLGEGADLAPALGGLEAAGISLPAEPVQAGRDAWVEVGGLASAEGAALMSLQGAPGVDHAMALGGYAVPLA